ncbi:MAG: T9SS type A sorting domain-containing protein [Bacteroidales bacterium]|nr:T9SS type A sorting domain-containing protein [Bacteroidales bacterium]
MKPLSVQLNIFNFIFILVISVFSSTAKAQILSDFTARQKAGAIELIWTFNSGETCDGTWVKHGTDSLSLETIYHVPGICGAASKEVRYEYIHEFPEKNTMNYYRLELGNRGFSAIVRVYFDDVGNGFAIYGNPLTDYSEIILSNDFRGNAEVIIYDQNGKIHLQERLSKKAFKLYREQFNSGLYFIIVRFDNKKVFKEKIMVI